MSQAGFSGSVRQLEAACRRGWRVVRGCPHDEPDTLPAPRRWPGWARLGLIVGASAGLWAAIIFAIVFALSRL